MPPPVEEPIGLFVTRSARQLAKEFDDVLATAGGSLPMWLVLVSLHAGAHGSQRSIAEEIGIEGPTLTHHLNRMETDGLVTRARDPENRRVHQVVLTDDGKAMFRLLLSTVQRFDRRLRSNFSDDELTTLRDLLGRLAANASAPDRTPRSKETFR